jgi:hypothetical protein
MLEVVNNVLKNIEVLNNFQVLKIVDVLMTLKY